uniref:Uncharacterized protein n=1 Tax=Chromera velia CCMP2878 TaxID=1169474 RepID=A0A0G4I5Z8_9ALVE|mmetsp:Transcript_22877/g.45069  ORF Transcript_22877/g.45069 Transcript_22877/m.45069 type:complete len:111 (+) Transcript_22877:264-596(+)|eukprot:Cvel_1870.t1-p1 / transcript=Cvel_1870.t1 / gene=Cvel_1870 / organism=Chromera_velia_CCMP2878 / gene_product=hypothetical protein / transcript_product=hypothetical protein / location=Cvel_scaffold69:124081-124749(-) / protein_length=110 / sequence_SO=supercontig / SO=protein_coding / is_pseudo=false
MEAYGYGVPAQPYTYAYPQEYATMTYPAAYGSYYTAVPETTAYQPMQAAEVATRAPPMGGMGGMGMGGMGMRPWMMQQQQAEYIDPATDVRPCAPPPVAFKRGKRCCGCC